MVHINAALPDISVAFLQAQENYLAAQVFPVVPVAKQSDRYFVYSIGDLLRDEAEIRAPGTESAGSAVSIDNTPSYYCDDWSIHEDVSDMIVANADSPISPKKDAAENNVQKLLTRSEVLWASKFFGAGLGWTDWTATASGTAGTSAPLQWGSASADPILDIDAAVNSIRMSTGFKPNTVVLSPDVFYAAKNHPKVIDRVKYGGLFGFSPVANGYVTEQALAGLWGVKRVLVAWAVKNSASEGQTNSIGGIFSNGAFVCYAAESPGIRKVSAGYTFSWNGLIGNMEGHGYVGGSAGGTPYIRMRQFRMEHLESDRVEGGMPIDHKMVCANLGIFIANVLTT
jgi:hypothetical protein